MGTPKYDWRRVLAAAVRVAKDVPSKRQLAFLLGMPERTFAEGLYREFQIETIDQLREYDLGDSGADVEPELDLLLPRQRQPYRVVDPVVELVEALPYEASTDDWVELFSNIQKLLDKIDPVYSHQTVRISGDKPVGVIFSSDWHLGSRFVCYPRFRDLYEWCAGQERLLWVLLGDHAENMHPDFYAARPVLAQLTKPSVQRKLLATLFEKIRGKILCHTLGTGAHTTERQLGESLIRQWFVERGLCSFIGQGLLTMELGTQCYELFVSHKLPGSSIHNPLHSQGRALKEKAPFADVIVSGHYHRFAASELSHHEIGFRAGKLPTNRTWLLQVGTSVDGQDPHALSAWEPGVFEWPLLVFMSDQHKVIRVGRKEDLEYYLA